MKTLADAIILCIMLINISGCSMNPDAKRLYDDLLSNYNKLVRPVINITDPLSVKIKIKLSQLIDINLKNQIMTTNLWVEQYWYDYKLSWNPKEYGGVEGLHVPSEHVWRPDIVLYNNADGNFEVTLATKAILHYTGRVEWKPPAIYKSSCEIDVEFFPFDEQTCVLKFGSWTYDGFQVDLRHVDEDNKSRVVDVGVDLSEFYASVEWDILEVPAIRNEKYYTCCEEPYLDITFNITMRRKTLFYTVNLIIPCMGISFLTILVFYLPSDSNEKVSLSISILLSLTVFFLLLAEIIPPTSLVVPLLGKFVLFTMILDTLSICVTVVVLNIHFRSPTTHVMSPWVRRVFIHILPRMLIMRRPHYQMERKNLMGACHRILVKTCQGLELQDQDSADHLIQINDLFSARDLESGIIGCCEIHGPIVPIPSPNDSQQNVPLPRGKKHWHDCPELHKAVEGAGFIADYIRKEEEEKKIKEDWKYVAMVLDRLFLWIFTLAVTMGSAGIILQAPTLYDSRLPIDVGTYTPTVNQNYNNIM
ncbi:acetylcholine receptor subunit alpha-like [Adelges cooleyi]|uniref:acetylcholine receptor subunit alpha-like n=1 Tax=Adelges cooleyi TaxID=133065 RepID=UPI00217F8D0E|nr:acetylcholine receptor subunit alpha-like [Adelges cooleyi]